MVNGVIWWYDDLPLLLIVRIVTFGIICVRAWKKTREIYTGIEIQFWLWKGFKNIILTIDCKFKTLFDAHLNSKKYIKTAYLYQILYSDYDWFITYTKKSCNKPAYYAADNRKVH